MGNKTYSTSIIQNPASIQELDFNELKLNALIMDIERDILALRMEKMKKAFEEQKLAKTRLEEEPPAKKSWWAAIFSKA
jgi:hypothetical protein